MSGPGDPIGAHLATLPRTQRDTLTALRLMLRDLLPDAEEHLSYGMPCFTVGGVAVAASTASDALLLLPHSGDVVTKVSGVPAWCTVASKGTLQLPVDRTLPKGLVRKLIRARLDEIAAKDA